MYSWKKRPVTFRCQNNRTTCDIRPAYRYRPSVLDWHSRSKGIYSSAFTLLAQGFGQVFLALHKALHSPQIFNGCLMLSVENFRVQSQFTIIVRLAQSLCAALTQLLRVCKALAQPFWNELNCANLVRTYGNSFGYTPRERALPGVDQ